MSKRCNSFSFYTLVFFLLFQAVELTASVPAGYYYYAKNKKQAELKTALNTYCKPLREFDYGSGPGFTWEGFFYTDRNADNYVVDMYSDSVRNFSGFSSVEGMHIEHSFPKSWWGGYDNGAYKDLFHLYPADGLTNSTKNDLPLGEVTGTPTFYNGKSKIGKNGFGTTYAGNCFEPADEYKGDFARSYFYIATVYQELYPLFVSPMLDNNSYPVWKNWALDLLMKWHLQDPVSAKELARIEAVYNIQGNRNPFIDYPDLTNYIWGNKKDQVFPFPEETEPFMLTPRAGNKMDMGVILSGNTRTQSIRIQGVNLNADLQVALLNNEATLQLSTTTISQAGALSGVDLSLTFSPTEGGLVRDTLLITGGGLATHLKIPVKALASVDFVALEPTNVTPVSAELQWIADPIATNYRLNVYQGDNQAGDLIISGYVEGSSWNKAIELYNGTGKTIHLSKYGLQKQSNGAGSFGSALKLSGSLESGKSFVIVHNSSTNADLRAKANLLTDTLLQFNGNDAICLVHGGVIIDMVGQADAGASVNWGENLTLERKSSVTHPISVFNPNEWNTYGVDVFNMLGNHTMNLTPHRNNILEVVLTGNATSYYLPGLMPENTYTYKIESLRSGVYYPAVNTMQLHTSALDVPVVMEPTDILPTQFTANWEQTLYATGYLLNVYGIKGQVDSTETEGFNTVGASGSPLPTGWTGTASGNYTTATSSGNAVPSISLKNNGEWLQTKVYPQPISKLSFMYRFPSAATGSSFVIDGLKDNSWIRIDSVAYKGTTLKTYPVYDFTKSQQIKSLRFKFNKSTGNLALDDVSLTYGNQDSAYVLKDHQVTGEELMLTNIEPNTLYYYNVRATFGNYVSAFSETIAAKTLIDTPIDNTVLFPVKIYHNHNQLHINGLKGNETIRIYNTAGICMYNKKAFEPEMNIPFKQKGVFIVNIMNGAYQFTGKIIVF
ncbi:MAG TPA: endonuclease [Paludibacter sp.]|nr:endonuclease [Paludibacter sp.]